MTDSTQPLTGSRLRYSIEPDAKARIAVYGTVGVIKALARFEESGAVLSHGPASRAFVSLVSTMWPKSGDVSEHELELLLLGTLPNKTPHTISGPKPTR